MIFLNTVTTTYSIDWEFLKLAAPFASILLSLATFIMALKLYDRHGLKKIIFEKKLKAVLELAEKIKRFPIVIINDNNSSRYSWPMPIHLSLETSKDLIYYPYPQHFERPIISTYFYMMNQLSVFDELKNNPYLPEKISYSLNFLNFCPMPADSVNAPEGFALIQSENPPFGSEFMDHLAVTSSGIALREFILGFENTLKEIKKWLDKYAPLDDPIRL